MDPIRQLRVVQRITADLETLPSAERRDVIHQVALLYHVALPSPRGDGRKGSRARMSESIPEHIRRLGGKASTQQIARSLKTSYHSAAVLISRAVKKGLVRRIERNLYGIGGGE